MPAVEAAPPARAWHILVASLLLILPYGFTLSAPFDFSDDGCLVYGRQGSCWERVWARTWEEFHRIGPFRPISWAHWEIPAGLFGAHPLPHRLLHLVWAYLGAALLVWFFLELGLRRWPCWFACAVAMWVPYRNEIWNTLGLTEAFAMPYALLALVAALRAARSQRPWPWDLTAFVSALLAIGCKNTFAAIVPAQVYLRLTGAGLPLREGWQRQRGRALLLATVLLLPLCHLVAFQLDPGPKEYSTRMFGRMDVLLWLCAIMDAVGLEFFLPGLVVLGVFLWRTQAVRRSTAQRAPSIFLAHRGPFTVACLLLICGVGIYLPFPGLAGRYTIPAAWGADLALALFLTAVAESPPSSWKRLGYGALGLGLLVTLGFNVEHQSRFAARSKLLWQALQFLEDFAPTNATVVWYGPPQPTGQHLTPGEGIHFGWHLGNRAHKQLRILSPWNLTPQQKREVLFVLSGDAKPPGDPLKFVCEFMVPYGLVGQAQHCYLWQILERTPS